MTDPVERRYHWIPPGPTARLSAEMAGIDFLKAWAAGEIPPPPIMDTLDFGLIEVEEGRVVFEGRPGPPFYNPIGTVHGGWIAAILDSAASCCVHATLEAGAGYTTAELKINYVRAVTEATGPCRCEGRVIHRGRRMATSESRLIAADGGKLLAHATATCMIFDSWRDRGRESSAAAEG